MRTKKDQGRTYLQIVESYREGESVRQRVIATLGRLDRLTEKGQVDQIVRSLARYAEKVSVSEDYAGGKLEAKNVTHIGPDLVMNRLWRELGVADAVSSLTSARKHSFSIERALYLATLSRLFFPGSDRRAHRVTRDYRVTGAEGIELHHLYRAMAWLGENRERCQRQ